MKINHYVFRDFVHGGKIHILFIYLNRYLSEEEYNTFKFKQLVGGVIWILRNGTGFVNVSKRLECEDSQETGILYCHCNFYRRF